MTDESEVRPITDKLLMSDVLQGQVPELEGDGATQLASGFVIAIINVSTGVDSRGIVGTLRGLKRTQDGSGEEISVRTPLGDAVGVIDAVANPRVSVSSIELHVGEDIVRFIKPDSGLFAVTEAEILEIDYPRQVCVLNLKLA